MTGQVKISSELIDDKGKCPVLSQKEYCDLRKSLLIYILGQNGHRSGVLIISTLAEYNITYLPLCMGIRLLLYHLVKEIEITSWKARAYGIFTRVGEVSEIEQVRFLILHQRV